MRRWHSLLEIIQFPLKMLFVAIILTGLGTLITNQSLSVFWSVNDRNILLLADLFKRTGSFIIVNFPFFVMIKFLATKSNSSVPIMIGITGYVLVLVIAMLFYHGSRSPYPWSLCWLDEFADPTTARKLYTAAFPLVDITVVPDDEIVQHRRVALLELIQKHIRQRDLMGLIDQLVVLLVTECANDSQITALLNYILLTGDEARFNEFISEITRRLPQQRERIMTIAERIHNDGYIKGEQRILRLFLQNGADPEWIQKITGLSAEQMQALEQPLPDREHDSWLES